MNLQRLGEGCDGVKGTIYDPVGQCEFFDFTLSEIETIREFWADDYMSCVFVLLNMIILAFMFRVGWTESNWGIWMTQVRGNGYLDHVWQWGDKFLDLDSISVLKVELTGSFPVLIMGCDRKRREWLRCSPNLVNELPLTEMAKTTREGGLRHE